MSATKPRGREPQGKIKTCERHRKWAKIKTTQDQDVFTVKTPIRTGRQLSVPGATSLVTP